MNESMRNQHPNQAFQDRRIKIARFDMWEWRGRVGDIPPINQFAASAGLPGDAEIIEIRENKLKRCFEAIVSSSDWPVVPESAAIPILEQKL